MTSTDSSLIRVLLIEPHPALRKATAETLFAIEPVEVVAALDDYETGVRAALAMDPDTIVIGLTATDHHRVLTFCQRVRLGLPQCRLILCSSDLSHPTVSQQLSNAADALVSHEELHEKILPVEPS